MRRMKNDLRGHIAELMAKVQKQGALDQAVNPGDVEQFVGMLTNFGDLTGDQAGLVFKGSARSGYKVEPGGYLNGGVPWPKLGLDDILESEFWNFEMFNNLRYYWQATLMEPVGGMDMIIKGFERAKLPDGRMLKDLILTGAPAISIDVQGNQVLVQTPFKIKTEPVDWVISTMAPRLLSRVSGNFLTPNTKQMLASVEMMAACKVGWQAKYRFWEEEERIYGGISWTKDIIS